MSNGMCLNDALMKGPDQLMMLPYVLYKYREKKVAVTADVAAMFHQIQVKRGNLETQRFLWRKWNHKSCSPCISQRVTNMNSERFIQIFTRMTIWIVLQQ